jgi:hypothetical protein
MQNLWRAWFIINDISMISGIGTPIPLIVCMHVGLRFLCCYMLSETKTLPVRLLLDAYWLKDNGYDNAPHGQN